MAEIRLLIPDGERCEARDELGWRIKHSEVLSYCNLWMKWLEHDGEEREYKAFECIDENGTLLEGQYKHD